MSETFRAIRFSHKIAEKLTESYPSEIVNMYRSMNTCEEIATELELIDNYGITMNIAEVALSTALRQLIPKQEMKKLLTKHLSQASKKRNELYGSPQTKEGSQKGAKTRWNNMNKEQRINQSRKAIIAKGQVPWTKKETTTFFSMCTKKRYFYRQGEKTKIPNLELIAQQLIEQFHKSNDIRTARTLTIRKYNLKKTTYTEK